MSRLTLPCPQQGEAREGIQVARQASESPTLKTWRFGISEAPQTILKTAGLTSAHSHQRPVTIDRQAGQSRPVRPGRQRSALLAVSSAVGMHGPGERQRACLRRLGP